MNTPDHLIAGHWITGAGPAFSRDNPSTSQPDWHGHAATQSEIDLAVTSARTAFTQWSDTPLESRAEKITAIADGCRQNKNRLIDAICRQTGKPRWEAATEVDAMIAKAAITISAQQDRRRDSPKEITDIIAATRFVPVGVMAVLGPFNMPGHLPNGHLMPALLAGNTVIFKPSELTPTVGQVMAEIFHAASLPPGVFNMLQGGATTGTHLVSHPNIDGVLFTGSYTVGSAIHQSLAGYPEKMLALEMGGNNPLIVWDCADLQAAAYCIIQSAFITSGQRCSCARRLIVPDSQANAIVASLTATMNAIRVGLYSDNPEPFMGTVISPAAATKLLAAHAELILRGASPIVEMKLDPRSPALLSPGLIDVTDIGRHDTEHFGPLLQLIRVKDFDAAILEANTTRYGLSAGLISDRPDLYEQFRRRIRAGVMTFNRPLTGARSDLPFGGLGHSGNHRPSAAFAADYCTDPVAAVEARHVTLPAALAPGIEMTP